MILQYQIKKTGRPIIISVPCNEIEINDGTDMLSRQKSSGFAYWEELAASCR